MTNVSELEALAVLVQVKSVSCSTAVQCNAMQLSITWALTVYVL